MKRLNVKWLLVGYDFIILAVAHMLLMSFYNLQGPLTTSELLLQIGTSAICVFSARFVGGIYRQIWRYGGVQCYIRLVFTDGCGFLLNFALHRILPFRQILGSFLLAIACINLLCCLIIRMLYRYAYKGANKKNAKGRFLNRLLWIFSGFTLQSEVREETQKVKIAIIGAGRVGVTLAEELLNNSAAAYTPVCFVDIKSEKAGREVHGIPVLLENDNVFEHLQEQAVQEVVFALPNLPNSKRKELFESYLNAGYRIKAYDYPVMQTADGKRQLREFNIEELLFREPVRMADDKTESYYRGKSILITGGGGSIGSELCRQLAKMQPRRIVLVDIYENGAYDVQQELRISYGETLDLQVEIASITNRRAMERVFKTHVPQIVINAAAHKHVPLMENNCIEAVENNVFGTVVLVDLCEKFGVERFMMVSTDKAVNPTNVMGATKRMCEMIIQSASTYGKVKYSATRFGNVLGSAGSVIPLFKKQIANGGPVTITDKRIIRYFMTIPEAAQLVLQSGAMANNGELFVLDMGQPVKILDLANSMIRLSGVPGIEIVETGLRPGEKLYEELLVKTEELDKTENHLIFIERDTPCSQKDIADKLEILHNACRTEEDALVREALKKVVPTFRAPEIVNGFVEQERTIEEDRAAVAAN